MSEPNAAYCRHCDRPLARTHEHGWGHIANHPLACRTPDPRPHPLASVRKEKTR